jgi:hypothetical protein
MRSQSKGLRLVPILPFLLGFGACRSVDITYLGLIDQHIEVNYPAATQAVAARTDALPGIFIDSTSGSTDRSVAGTGIIAGRVVEPGGGGVSHAMISFVGGQPVVGDSWPSFYTDGTGSFEIRNVAAGDYTIAALQNGYQLKVVGGIRVSEGGRTDNVNIVLNPITGGAQ